MKHWATEHLTAAEIRINYERILSRALESIDEAVEEIEARLAEARDQGWLDRPDDIPLDREDDIPF